MSLKKRGWLELFQVGVPVIGGWIGQFEFFKSNSSEDIFLIIFQNFLNSSFSNIP